MFKVNSFLGCCSLETGGKIIGFFHVVGSFIAVFFIYGIEYDIKESAEHDAGSKALEYAVKVLIAVFFHIFAVVCFSASAKLIKSISERNQSKITFFLTLMKIFIVIDLLGFLGLIYIGATNDKITGAMISFCIHIYCVIVISSLYNKIQLDSMHKSFNNPLTAHVVQMPPPCAQNSSQTHPNANNGTTMPYENKM